MRKGIKGKLVLSIICASVIVVIFIAAIKFLVIKEFYFIVETECNEGARTCFHRDCSINECPPNGLENYRIFKIAAHDYSQCNDQSCLFECGSLINCEEVLCDVADGDECSTYQYNDSNELNSAENDEDTQQAQ